jgi:putative NADH-flavin reductase
LGATGRTGKELVAQALERGHRAAALVRSPQKMPVSCENLSILRGDPRNQEHIRRTLEWQDDVVSALGHAGLGFDMLLADAAIATCKAMQDAGIKRLLVVSTALLFPGGGLTAALLRRIIRHPIGDSRAMEDLIGLSGLDWTIARPPRLVEKDSGVYRIFEGFLPSSMVGISRKTLAGFLLDALEHGEHIRKIVGIYSPRPAKSHAQSIHRLDQDADDQI